MNREISIIDYISPFYSRNHTEGTLIRGIDSLLGSHKDLKVYLFPVYIDPLYWDNLKRGRRYFRLLSENDGVRLFEFSFEIRRLKRKEQVTGKLLITENRQYEDIYTVVSLGSSFFFSKRVLSYFDKAYPRASLTFITHKKLKNLLINFRDKNALDLTIVRATSHSRIGKKIMTSVSWPEFSIEKAFEWIAGENGWFRNLTFKVKRPLTPTVEISISISRNGVIKSNGYFGPICEDFILPISKTIHENVGFFSKRARLDNPNRDIRPLSINFVDEQFTDLEENQRFISAMRTMKAASVSVMHGNPYIHLSIFDYFDGSSFDIWVLSADRIIIVPQLKASFQSIKRLINHIFDNYAEGDIKDYKVE